MLYWADNLNFLFFFKYVFILLTWHFSWNAITSGITDDLSILNCLSGFEFRAGLCERAFTYTIRARNFVGMAQPILV